MGTFRRWHPYLAIKASGRGSGASAYMRPVHGLPAVAGDPAAGCRALAGGVGPSPGLRLPPLPGGHRRGRGHGRSPGAGNVGPPLLGMLLVLQPQGAGMAAVCPTGYADDTQAITLDLAAAPMAEAQAITDRTAVWMADTGQSGNAAKSTLWLLREPRGGVAPLTLGGVAIPLSREFKQLGVGQRLDQFFSSVPGS